MEIITRLINYGFVDITNYFENIRERLLDKEVMLEHLYQLEEDKWHQKLIIEWE